MMSSSQWWAAKEDSQGLMQVEMASSDIASSDDKNKSSSSSSTSARACSNSALIVFGVLLAGLCFVFLDHLLSAGLQQRDENEDASKNKLHNEFVRSASNSSIASYLRELTRQPHVAGTQSDFDTAAYVLAQFQAHGFEARYSDYEVLLTYPVERNLSLTTGDGEHHYFELKEQTVPGDEFSGSDKVVPSFHGFSPSGDVEAGVVYVNYGREEDYELLRTLGVNPQGSIVLARYGKIFRGDIVSIAAKAGAAAAIVFSDPADYAANGTQGYYPRSGWLPPSGLQRGTTFDGVGDPLTPGWPSTTSAERISASQAGLPLIPSLPISATDARSILSSLTGTVAPKKWHGGLALVYRIGGEGPVKLHFRYVANQTITRIRNVLAVVEGHQEPDRIVVLGNHRDAWTFGAVDPNSGTAALLEIARNFGKLVERGWSPRRTIVLCSWDAEEYGMLGSTEWVEQNIDLLHARAVAYLNVDCGVSGPGFVAAATPQLDELLMDVAKEIKDPDAAHSSLYDAWLAEKGDRSELLERLGDTGSDHAAFLQHAGVPSADLHFGKTYSVYHSAYDNYNWMKRFGDPLFHRHAAIASLWGLTALRLADSALLPFTFKSYVSELKKYGQNVESALSDAKAPQNVTVQPLHEALSEFRDAVQHFSEEAESVAARSSSLSQLKRRELNDRMMLVERAFLEAKGLPRKSWHKHLVYGPSKSNGYSNTYFPGVMDSIALAENVSWSSVQHEIFRVARVVSRAAVVLQGELVC